jgi:flagellar protein FlgJ
MSVAPITSASAPLIGQPTATLELGRLQHAKATQLKGAALRNAAEGDQRAAVGAQFEAILVRQLVGPTLTKMMATESGGVSGSVYGDMLADTIAQQLTAGQGLGLGRYLEKQLAPKGKAPAAPDQMPTISGSESHPSSVSGPSSPVLHRP